MKNSFFKVGVLLTIMTLVGCTTTSNQSNQSGQMAHQKSKMTKMASNSMENSAPGSSQDVGIARVGMDEADRSKLSHALDKAPGKSTHWMNPNTNVAYTVTPIRAVTIGGNHNCRKYSVMSVSGTSRHESSGTACVGDDSAWKAV